MYVQAPDADAPLDSVKTLHSPTTLHPVPPGIQQRGGVLFVAFLIAAFCVDGVRAQVSAFQLKRGHISQLIVDQGAQLAHMVRVDADGQEVGKPFDVLIQHRSGPKDQAIDERWARVDSVITCFPATIEDPQIRAKAILSSKTGAIQVRRYASGIVIVEPVDAGKQPTPVFLAESVQ